MSGRIKAEIALHDNSLDSSPNAEFVSVDDESYGSGEENSFETQAYLEPTDSTSLTSMELSSGVTYKLIPLATSDDSGPTMQSSPTPDTYYMTMANHVEVFATTAPSVKMDREKRPIKRNATGQQSKVITAKKRDDKRRATHNEVERRRRDKINTWIMKLAALVPNSGMPDSASKGGILAKACDHIVELKDKHKRLEKLEVENEKLVLEVLRLNQELTDLRKENTSFRNQLADNCIVFSHRQKEDKS